MKFKLKLIGMLRLCLLLISIMTSIGLSAQSTYINEVSYLATSTHRGFEVAGLDGTNIDGWTAHLYNDEGFVYQTKDLSGTFTDDAECIGFIWVDIILAVQEGSGIALVDASNVLVQYLTYGGITSGQDGPANGVASTDIGVQNSMLPNLSRQLIGTGFQYGNFTWALPDDATPGDVNVSQTISCTSLLPVEWAGFSAEIIDDSAIGLVWKTYSESNSDYYQIEHSSDGVNFKRLGQIASAGNSDIVSSYSFTHEQPVKGQNYYRLKQVDLDGQYEYSELIALNLSNTASNQPYLIYPNPVVNTMHIDDELEGVVIGIQIKDLSGRVKLSLSESTKMIDLSQLPEGMYIISLIEKEEIRSQLFVISRN